MTSNDRGRLLGAYSGSWHRGALTALFPLLWFLFVLPGVMSTGRWTTLVMVTGAAVVYWLVVAAWVLVRRGTRLEIFERAVVWTRPVLGKRVFSVHDLVRVQRIGLDATRAVRVTLTNGNEQEIVGFAQLAEIANLLEGSRRAVVDRTPTGA
ncbi:MAG: hypothetical protein J0L92_37915 [Deltaproteobacteria bacterium]|nr:hypothetical protein [Deltaproteobacteria bacterium]